MPSEAMGWIVAAFLLGAATATGVVALVVFRIHKLRPANACPKHASLPLPGVEAVRGLPCPECYLELEGYPTEVDDLLEEKVEMPQCLVGAERYVIMAGMWELGAGYGWSLVWARVKDIEAAK